MVIKSPSVHPLKQETRHPVKCPVCGETIKIGVEDKYEPEGGRYPFPHIVLHGNPLHALVAYIDKHGNVRGVEASGSVEIKQGQAVLSDLLAKWSNPF